MLLYALNTEILKSPIGIAAILFFLLIFYLIGRLIKSRDKKNRSSIAPRIMRYLVLPMAAIHLIMFYVIGLGRGDILIKITETILSIVLISFCFNAINYLFFSEHNLMTRKEIVPKLGRDIIHFFLITIISAVVLSNVWELDLGGLITALGVSSLVIGLALQEPLGNLFNGVSLMMSKPFERGDWISIGDETGKVMEFNWRAVQIVNRFNEMIIIPNNVIGKEKIKNLSRPSPIHAEMVKIGFSYDNNPNKVKEVLLSIIQDAEGVLDNPAPTAITLSYDDFAITYGVKFYIKDFEDSILLTDIIMTEVYSAAKRNGLTIPYPKQDLEVRIIDPKI